MPQVDDEYRKKAILARIKENASKREQGRISKAPKEPNIPANMMPYQAKATPISKNAARMGLVVDGPLPVDPSGAAGMGSVAGKGVAAATAAALKSKPLQSALQTVESAGTKRMSDFIGKDVNGLTQADLPRYGMAARGKLVDFLNENLASGELTVQQANRLVKAIPYHYIGDGTSMARELAGGSLDKTSRMMFGGAQARADIASGAAKGVFKQGPEELTTYLYGKLLQSQNRVMGIVDEWH